jgi:FMN reductase
MSHSKVVLVTGSPTRPSRTRALAESVVAEISQQLLVDVEIIDIADIGTELGGHIFRQGLPLHLEAALQHIESASLLVVATPVYKGSYTGLFKHLFDLVSPDALVGKPVLLAATGGGGKHALVIEHQLRPLFGFFRALTLPTGVYGAEADLKDYTVSSPGLNARVRDASAEAIAALRQQGAVAANATRTSVAA